MPPKKFANGRCAQSIMQGFGKDSVFENSSQGSCCSCVCVSLYLSLCLLLKTHTFHAYHTGHSRLSAEHSNRPSCECTLTLGIIHRAWLTALRLIVATIIFISPRADAMFSLSWLMEQSQNVSEISVLRETGFALTKRGESLRFNINGTEFSSKTGR